MRKSIPKKDTGVTSAMVLLILGGLLVFASGIAALLVGSFVNHIPQNLTINGTNGTRIYVKGVVGKVGLLGEVAGTLGIISGIIMMACAVMLYRKPQKAELFGVIGLIFTIISLSSSGGFFIGFVLGLVGSIMGIMHNK